MPTEQADPTRPSLMSVLDDADRLSVYDCGVSAGILCNPASLVFELTDTTMIAEAVKFLEVEDRGCGRCLCDGGPTMQFYSSGTLTATLSIHHGKTARWDNWAYDAPLRNGRGLLEWLASNGFSKPLHEYELSQNPAVVTQQQRREWRSKIPVALIPFWDGPWSAGLAPTDMRAVRNALIAAAPNNRERLLALLTWHGSGAGPWRTEQGPWGHPGYESLVHTLLMDFDTQDLMDCMGDTNMSDRAWEGAARLYQDERFIKRWPHAISSLSADVRAKLLAAGLNTDDADRISRALRAYATTDPH